MWIRYASRRGTFTTSCGIETLYVERIWTDKFDGKRQRAENERHRLISCSANSYGCTIVRSRWKWKGRTSEDKIEPTILGIPSLMTNMCEQEGQTICPSWTCIYRHREGNIEQEPWAPECAWMIIWRGFGLLLEERGGAQTKAGLECRRVGQR